MVVDLVLENKMKNLQDLKHRIDQYHERKQSSSGSSSSSISNGVEIAIKHAEGLKRSRMDVESSAVKAQKTSS